MRPSFTKHALRGTVCAVALSATLPGVFAYAAPSAVHTAKPGASGAGQASSATGRASAASVVAQTGYYDGHKVLFILTDTSSKAEAKRDGINYSANLAPTLSTTVPIYLISNGTFAGRGPVFGSQPGEKDYTPLWQEVGVTWINPAAAVPLGSDNQINGLAKAGKLTLTVTRTVLNCPIIKVLGGS